MDLAKRRKAHKQLVWKEKRHFEDQEWLKVFSLLHPNKNKEFWHYINSLSSDSQERRNAVPETSWMSHVTLLYNNYSPGASMGDIVVLEQKRQACHEQQLCAAIILNPTGGEHVNIRKIIVKIRKDGAPGPNGNTAQPV